MQLSTCVCVVRARVDSFTGPPTEGDEKRRKEGRKEHEHVQAELFHTIEQDGAHTMDAARL